MKAEESVRSFIERNGWIRDCHVTVAFSGGYDSLCLLILLKKHLTTVSALYVNHNLRPEEELARELEINRDNCARLDVPLEIVTLKRGEIERIARERGITIEAAARDARYRVFENRGIIATAHNRNDQVETVMMKLLSGGTLLSLAGRYLAPVYGFSALRTKLRTLLERMPAIGAKALLRLLQAGIMGIILIVHTKTPKSKNFVSHNLPELYNSFSYLSSTSAHF